MLKGVIRKQSFRTQINGKAMTDMDRVLQRYLDPMIPSGRSEANARPHQGERGFHFDWRADD